MITRSTNFRQHYKDFKKDLGHLLHECRLKNNKTLSQVANETGWQLGLLERMEMGKLPTDFLWKVIRLARFYGYRIKVVPEEKGE